jgi:NitT/TauT family transport system permease protein
LYKAPEDDENKRKNTEDVEINLDKSQPIEESEIISLDDNRSKKNKIPLKKKIKLDEFSNTILFIAVFIGLWQLAYLSGIWPKVSLPPPIMVLESFYELILDNTLLVSVGMTLYRLLIGFAASIGIGVCVGLAMVRFSGFGKTMSSFAIGLQSFPSVAWVPFAILLIGLNDIGILFVVIMSSVFSVMMSAYSGIRNIPTIYLKAARNMGAKGFSLFRHLMIPAATPALIIGMKQAWSFAWHALVGAEILMAAAIGIGHILLVGREFSLMDQIIASMITIFALGMIFDKVIFAKLEDRVREKWGLRQEQDIENK